jgi:5'-AMP-activated protein kinase catalytic alpha subunit
MLKTACGSPCYAAPEMIAGSKYHGLQVDIWSCGVILYAMLCGYLPFEDPDTNKLYRKILKCDYHIPSFVNSMASDLIQKILNTDPEKRYTLQQIRSHPWFLKNTEPKLDQNLILNPKDIFINLKVLENMIKNYKLPRESFDLTETLKALASNKHNDQTTTYYLLHKKWLKSNSKSEDLVKLTLGNYE